MNRLGRRRVDDGIAKLVYTTLNPTRLTLDVSGRDVEVVEIFGAS